MNRGQKEQRRRERHERQVSRRLYKQGLKRGLSPSDIRDAEIEDLTEDGPIHPIPEPIKDSASATTDDLEELNVEGGESLEKDMYAEPVMAMGATSWDELDDVRATEEKTRKAMDTSYDAERLVRNIINHPMLDPEDKSDAIQAVGAGFGPRVNSILSGKISKSNERSVEALEIEALMAHDRRHSPISEVIGDWFHKAVLSPAAREAKPDEEFALVTERDGGKVRKYPIHDKAHVRNALARAAQQIKTGGDGAADARAALPKIRSAAKSMGIEVSTEKNSNAILVQKDANGDWRWVGWASNNFIDFHGDIISKNAHQEYVEWLENNREFAPMFMSWHTPGTQRKNPVDFWTVEKGFLIMSGKLEEEEAAGLFEVMKEVDLGMSISGVAARDPNDPRVITQYRAIEVSDLPLEDAANPFTDFAVISKEVEVNKATYLASVLGSPEKAAEFLKKTGLKAKALAAAGVESKSKAHTEDEEENEGEVFVVKKKALKGIVKSDALDGLGDNDEVEIEILTGPEDEEGDGDEDGDEDGESEPSAVESAVAKAKATASKLPAPTRAVVEAVIKELHLDELNEMLSEHSEAVEKVGILETVIKSMQTDQDEALAEKISPPASRFVWMKKHRASVADETKVKDGEDDMSTPGLGDDWLSEVTGTKALEPESVR